MPLRNKIKEKKKYEKVAFKELQLRLGFIFVGNCMKHTWTFQAFNINHVKWKAFLTTLGNDIPHDDIKP